MVAQVASSRLAGVGSEADLAPHDRRIVRCGGLECASANRCAVGLALLGGRPKPVEHCLDRQLGAPAAPPEPDARSSQSQQIPLDALARRLQHHAKHHALPPRLPALCASAPLRRAALRYRPPAVERPCRLVSGPSIHFLHTRLPVRPALTRRAVLLPLEFSYLWEAVACTSPAFCGGVETCAAQTVSSLAGQRDFHAQGKRPPWTE